MLLAWTSKRNDAISKRSICLIFMFIGRVMLRNSKKALHHQLSCKRPSINPHHLNHRKHQVKHFHLLNHPEAQLKSFRQSFPDFAEAEAKQCFLVFDLMYCFAAFVLLLWLLQIAWFLLILVQVSFGSIPLNYLRCFRQNHFVDNMLHNLLTVFEGHL